jgi:hypothetical protein
MAAAKPGEPAYLRRRRSRPRPSRESGRDSSDPGGTRRMRRCGSPVRPSPGLGFFGSGSPSPCGARRRRSCRSLAGAMTSRIAVVRLGPHAGPARLDELQVHAKPVRRARAPRTCSTSSSSPIFGIIHGHRRVREMTFSPHARSCEMISSVSPPATCFCVSSLRLPSGSAPPGVGSAGDAPRQSS